MLAGDDQLTANGGILRLIRTATAMGLGLATLDIREHSGKHHDALAGLFDRIGELETPYAELDREQRKSLLSQEMASRRPLVGANRLGLPDKSLAVLDLLGSIRTALDTYGPDVIRDLHRLDDPRRRRRVRRRGAGPGGRAGRPGQRHCRPPHAWASRRCSRPSLSWRRPARCSRRC